MTSICSCSLSFSPDSLPLDSVVTLEILKRLSEFLRCDLMPVSSEELLVDHNFNIFNRLFISLELGIDNYILSVTLGSTLNHLRWLLPSSSTSAGSPLCLILNNLLQLDGTSMNSDILDFFDAYIKTSHQILVIIIFACIITTNWCLLQNYS